MDGKTLVQSWLEGVWKSQDFYDSPSWITLMNAIDAAIAQAVREEREAHRVTDAFTCEVMDKMVEWEFSLDGADIQELAVESGVLTETKYDPELHGENSDASPGDTWYVFSEAYHAIRARTP